uniref:Genetic suppressor element-like domain-containing protein n=1 Tax=Poecilia formosa TaxID=48698 RepID=A0A087YHR7_POEFO
RLMAASMPGEDSALPRSTSRADRNGLGGLVHCFICGSGVTPGKELRLQVTYQKERSPFFPFLQNQEPAPGACELSPDGCALVCAVCHCFLTEQWNSFERSRTPIEKRMYWLKRPYQCDSRRVPQEWNISYDLERRISVGSHNYDGGAESDFSSFSENENLSDQEMDLVERVGKDKCLRAPVKFPRDSSSSCAPSSHPSLLHRGRAEGNSSAAPSPVIPKCNSAVAREINSDNSGEDQEINITSDDERDIRGAKAGPTTQLRAASDPSARRVSHHPASSSAEERVCYICGSGLRHGAHFKISVQKQERAQGEPFFPFLWLHSAPRGAVPISPSGTTIVCGSCHSSLMQQWESFQLADVPVLQRLYVVPLNQTSSASGLHPSQHNTLDRRTPGSLEVTPEPKPSHEACFLCGQEGRGDLRVVYAKAGIGKSRAVMYFPFIGLLPCPPNAQAVKNGRVHCCPQCHAILQDIWGAYRLSLSEDLITSVSSFLVRYHSSLSADGSGPVHSQVGVVSRHSSSLSVCYLCGAELSAGAEYQLHVNPPSRFVEREPFFPFLTVYPPAPGAKPVDATGLVSACKLCYHDLHSQWAQHESVPGANSHPSSSQWARQYSCEAFVCFFCRQEQHRQGRLCAVTVARLPVFLYAPRSPRMLLVDDGRRLVI